MEPTPPPPLPASGQDIQARPAKQKLPAGVHLMCGWPLLLVIFGGAIGGGLGGAAYGINIGIYKSNLPVPVKIILNVVTGGAAFGIWLAIAMAIRSKMK